MATGPEHYRVAERTLDEVVSGIYPDEQQITFALAKAQVHATLALAAATALQRPVSGVGAADSTSWLVVASEYQEWPRP